MATARTRIHRRQLAGVMLAAAAITPFFNLLTSRASVAEAVQGVVDAVLVSLLTGGYLIFVRDGRARAWFRRLGFRTDLALTCVIVLVLFLVGRATGRALTWPEVAQRYDALADQLLTARRPAVATPA